MNEKTIWTVVYVGENYTSVLKAFSLFIDAHIFYKDCLLHRKNKEDSYFIDETTLVYYEL